MADRPLSAALIGAGMISLYHLRAWEKSGVPVVAICDTDRSKAEARASEFGVDRVYDNPERLFADGGFRLVDIAAGPDKDLVLLILKPGRVAPDRCAVLVEASPRTASGATVERAALQRRDMLGCRGAPQLHDVGFPDLRIFGAGQVQTARRNAPHERRFGVAEGRSRCYERNAKQEMSEKFQKALQVAVFIAI